VIVALRLVKWFVLSLLIALALILGTRSRLDGSPTVLRGFAPVVHAQDDCQDETCEEFAYQPPYPSNICELVTQYGWWWYFLYCDQRDGLAAESTATIDRGDSITIQIHRRYHDGREVFLERVIRRRR
jgi:hypothetical protein